MLRERTRPLRYLTCLLFVSCASQASQSAPDATVARGNYLADAGNCYSCHTAPGGAAFAGGVRFETPFGAIYSTNITPDIATGIGRWTAADLRRAMHEGVAADGSRLFPAFPYPSYTKVSDADVDALYAYLRTLKPTAYTPPKNSVMFAMRWPLFFWNRFFFKEGRYQDDASQSEEWNRGAYLVEGLGHCSACHTPRDRFMAQISEKAYAGGVLTDKVADGQVREWSAVNITSAKQGLASWSVNDLKSYLHTGFSRRGGAFGPMNEVLVNSLMKLTPEDAQAMAVYLKSLPAHEHDGPIVAAEQAKPGEAIYLERCEKCHAESGRGGLFSGPPVAGSAIAQAANPASLINIILYGPEMPEEVKFGAWETMPGYADKLSDEEVVAVSNYVRGTWGNAAPPVTIDDVKKQR